MASAQIVERLGVLPHHGLERGEVVICLRPDRFGREGDEFLEHGLEFVLIAVAHFKIKLGEGGGFVIGKRGIGERLIEQGDGVVGRCI